MAEQNELQYIQLEQFISEAVGNNENSHNNVNDNFENKCLIEDDKEYQALLKKDKEIDIELKRHYGMSILHTLNIWVALVAFLLLLNLLPIKGFSDSVLITLLTTTTANILALPMIVIKYLFPNKK